MRNLSITVATVALLGSAGYVVAQNQLETVLDLTVREMLESGTKVSYEDRIIGADGSVEYTNLVITEPDEEIVISADWIKGVPSASDPEMVTITFADVINFTGMAEGVSYNFDLKSSGLELTTNLLLREAMSDSDVTVSYSADSLIIEGGDPDSPVLRELFADMGAIDFNVLFSETDMHAEGNFDAEKFNVVYDYTMDGQTQVTDQTSGAVSVVFDFDVPEDEEDAMGYVDGSMSAMVNMVVGAGAGTSRIEGEGIAFEMSGTYEPQESLIKMVDGIFTFEGIAGAMDYTITPGEGMPFPPVDISLDSTAMMVVIPAGATKAPKEMIVSMQLVDLVVGEGLWSMIDPGKTISRDPAQIDIDLEAMVQIDAGVAVSGGDPMELATVHSLDVNQIFVSAGGASIQADGAMTFDNSGPIPMPLGGIIIDINGITTLANQLVELGLLDQMQAGMAMGMMMAFGKPGPEADQFITELEFSENGITANGQPLQ